MKKYPIGLGMWIWKINQCDNGDWNIIINKCKNAGIRWLAIKSGDAKRNEQLNTENLKAILEICHQNNILVYSWNYSKPTTYKDEVIQITSLINDGIDGHIIDAEQEWQTYANSKPLATEFMIKLREVVGDVFLAHSPFPIVEYHLPFPYVEFGKYCDAVMPQSYWTEINWSFQKTFDKTDFSWKEFNNKHSDANIPVYPIGVTYGKGYPNVKGELTKEDIIRFIKRYPNTPISFYSYDASKNFKFVWDALTEIEDNNKKIPVAITPIIIDLTPENDVIEPKEQVLQPSFWQKLLGLIVNFFRN